MTENSNLNELFSDDFIKNLIVGIGEVSEITGVPTRQIRYWEDKKIIESVVSSGNTRRYNYINIKKILLIKELLDDGYTLDAATKKVEKRITSLNKALEYFLKK